MTQHHIYVFGNPDLPFDSLPLRLIPALQEALPEVTFSTLDPNEEWDVDTHMLIIDTIANITEPAIVHGLDAFMTAPRMTCHDFDAYANLVFLKKLGKISDVTVFGLPPQYAEKDSMAWLVSHIRDVVL